MIGTFVIFRYENQFDEQAVRNIAEAARPKFVGMPGLHSKTFTLNPTKREAVNFYLWESDAAARSFFNDTLLERVTALYGVRPSIEFVQIAANVENVTA